MKPVTVLLSTMLLSIPAVATACSCVAPPESDFLHATPGRDGQPTIYLPANARGMLFWAHPMLQWEGTDKDGHTKLSSVPPPLTASRFTIIELNSGKRVDALVSPLFTEQLDAVMGRERFVMHKTQRDISAEVRKAHGLFRVAPAGGFVSGRSYRVTYTPDAGRPVTVLTKLGPAVVQVPGQTFALQLDGPPVRRPLQMLDQSGSCSAERGAAVQALRIALPARYEAYRQAMTFFVLQKQALGYEIKRYVSSSCDFPSFGGSNLGALKELAYSTCDVAPAARKAKALVGMLELDDRLVETEVIDIRLDKATGPACSTFKHPELQDFN